MATVNQIYQIVNDSAQAVLGKAAITAVDTGTLVSLGNQVLSDTDTKDAVWKQLMDRIGRTAIAIREYKAKGRSIMRDELEWGFVYQKISYKEHKAVENPSWEFETQASPYDIESQTEIVQKLFSVMGTFSFEDSIPDYQLFTAFSSAERMGAFISGIYINMRNAMEVAEENLNNLALNTLMAAVINNGKPAQVRYLLDEYNTANGTELSEAQALTNSDFLKYATREISMSTGYIKRMSTAFNSSDTPRFTSEDKMVVEVLTEFARATASYLQADTYHDELVKLPMYEEVPYWQAPGTDYAFSSVSGIKITHKDINAGNPVEVNGIVACIHDKDAAAAMIGRRRDYSVFNPRSERLNIMMKADKGYLADTSENCIVFALKKSE